MEKIIKIKNWIEKNFLYILAITFLLCWYDIFLLKSINFITADLGRHIKNGELFFQNFEILKTNFYSYTYPEFPFVNHHWGSGALFYLIYEAADFSGLSFFFIVLSLITFFIFFRLAEKMVGFFFAFPVALLAIPLISERTEIRPEVVSYFFTAIFFWILWHWKNDKISKHWLWLLPFLEILWINSHIYFFLGFFLLAAFWLETLVFDKKKIKEITLISFFVALASLVNPFGIKGLFYPLFIFKNYGYQVVENKSMWFLQNLNVTHGSFYFFELALIILPLSFIAAFVLNRKKIQLNMLIISIVFLALSCMAIRNFTLLGFFLLPILSYNLALIKEKVDISNFNFKITSIFLAVVVFIFSFSLNSKWMTNVNRSHLGLTSEINASAEFFKKENLKGPIFNNYDIGSYLIYNLYPQEKVFVDNRPEAYPANFFQEVYISMQEKDDIWKKQLEKYNFNTIYFYLNDYTPWSQQFLVSRIKDPEWAPVYTDEHAIIFLRRNEENKNVISRFEIPVSNFNVK